MSSGYAKTSVIPIAFSFYAFQTAEKHAEEWMARKLPLLGEELVKEIEAAWARPQEDWARRRLLVVRLIAQHELTTEQIAKVAGVSRKSVFNYRDKVERGGVAELLTRDWAGARTPAVRGAVAAEFIARLAAGQFRQARDAQAWIKKRTRRTLSVSGALKVLRRLGGKLKVPRKSHAKKDPVKAAKFKLELPVRLSAVAGPAPTQPVRVWVLDEHRYGLLPVIRRVWGRRGVRVQAPYATRYQWGYLHEALEVDGAHAVELLFTPAIDRDIHALFLQQIADSDPSALHIVIQDQAGFHLPAWNRLQAGPKVFGLVGGVVDRQADDARLNRRQGQKWECCRRHIEKQKQLQQ